MLNAVTKTRIRGLLEDNGLGTFNDEVTKVIQCLTDNDEDMLDISLYLEDTIETAMANIVVK